MRVPVLFIAILCALLAPASAQAATIDVDSPTITEGDSGTTNLEFQVTLRDNGGLPALATFSTEDGSATAPDDYTATPSPAGDLLVQDTATPVSVPVKGDALDELSPETFKLKVDTLVATGEATGSITDDDPAPTLAIGDVTVGENGNAQFPISLSTASGQPVTLDYATQNGTAQAGADYTNTTGTVNFDEGETAKTVSVPVLPDTLDEPNESFTLTATGVSGGVVAPAATATIVDDDTLANLPPLARLSASPNPVYQGQVVILDGSGSSDENDDPLTYRWDIWPATACSDDRHRVRSPAAGLPSFFQPRRASPGGTAGERRRGPERRGRHVR